MLKANQKFCHSCHFSNTRYRRTESILIWFQFTRLYAPSRVSGQILLFGFLSNRGCFLPSVCGCVTGLVSALGPWERPRWAKVWSEVFAGGQASCGSAVTRSGALLHAQMLQLRPCCPQNAAPHSSQPTLFPTRPWQGAEPSSPSQKPQQAQPRVQERKEGPSRGTEVPLSNNSTCSTSWKRVVK